MKILRGLSSLFIALSFFYLAHFFIEYRINDSTLILCALMGLVIGYLIVTYPRVSATLVLAVVIAILAILGADLVTSVYKQTQAGEIAVIEGEYFLSKAVDPDQSEFALAKWVKEQLIVKYGIGFGEWLVYDRISAQLLWGEKYVEEEVGNALLVQTYRHYELLFSMLCAIVISFAAQLLLSRWLGFIGLFLPIFSFMALWYIYVDLPGEIFALYFFGFIVYLIMRQAMQLKSGEKDRQGVQRMNFGYYRIPRMVFSSLVASVVVILLTSILVAILPIKAINIGVDWALPNIWGARTEYNTQNYRLYSLGNTSFQQNGPRLGGPVGALDQETPLFWVEMDQAPKYSIYLKSQVKHIYNGNSWEKTEQIYKNNFENYLSQPQNRAFLEASKDTVISGEIVYDTLKTISIFTPMGFFESSLDPSKVFVSSENQAFYKGGIFISYLKGYAFKATQRDFTEPLPEDLQVSDTVSPQVLNFMKVFQIYGDTPQDRVALMIRYLKNNYKYNLAVSSKRIHPDFVTNFLVESREGYCTYFASAMAIMARVNGIPARYVEGFRVDPGEFDLKTNKAKVTEADAHAWVEVYFEGEGWRVVEATAPFTDTALQPEIASEEELKAAEGALLDGNGLDSTLPGNNEADAFELERLRLRDINLENAMFEDGSDYGQNLPGQSQGELEAAAREKAAQDAAREKKSLEQFQRLAVGIATSMAMLFAFAWWWPVVIRYKRVDLAKLVKLIYGYEALFASTQERLLASGAIIAHARDLTSYNELLPGSETRFQWERVLFSPAAQIDNKDIDDVLKTVERAYDDLLVAHRRSNGFLKHWIFRVVKRV